MIYRFVMVALASLLLAACGRGSEDFAFKVARPADKVEAAFRNGVLTVSVPRTAEAAQGRKTIPINAG